MSDSFEEIIYDAGLGPCGYARKRGSGPDDRVMCRGCMFTGSGLCDAKMRRDLVRRCKELVASEQRSKCEVADDENAGGSVNIGKVATFPGVKPDKAQALKVLEEAAEVFGAWQAFYKCDAARFLREVVLAECADVIQATCNLVASLGVTNLAPNMEECRERNEERGRFDD